MTENPPPSEPKQDAEPISREGFLKQGFGFLLSQIAESLPEIPGTEDLMASVVRPPGALPEKDFLATCQPFCTECQNACPRNAVFQDGFGFPYVRAEVSPCVMCTDVPCTKVCPTGALMPLDDPKAIAMGTAVIELTACTAYQGSGCQVCFASCPIPNMAIHLVEGLPQIVPEQCTGCGVCVYACPTPGALKIHPNAG